MVASDGGLAGWRMVAVAENRLMEDVCMYITLGPLCVRQRALQWRYSTLHSAYFIELFLSVGQRLMTFMLRTNGCG
jgi:hypothetical protein